MRGEGQARRQKARRGEALAALFLRAKGYRIEVRNWRCPLGEIDIIARRGGTLVFVEVKTRSGGSAGSPEEAVDERKRRQIVRLANVYLRRFHGALPPCRFDIVAVRWRGFLPKVRHLRGAFRADGLV
jgi:putative endonuclease